MTTATIDSPANCSQKYDSGIAITARHLLDAVHYFSTGVVSFARGLNDTPKIVALLYGAQILSPGWGVAAVAVCMAAGGLFQCRKVAETMSKNITEMTPEQGTAANIATGLLVIAASRYGLPVSTTHVSVGSIFGIGMLTRNANGRVVWQIILAWLLTLPTAAIIAAVVYSLFHS